MMTCKRDVCLMLLLGFGLLLPAGCSDDDPAAPEELQYQTVEYKFNSSDYLDNRFFSLDLPPVYGLPCEGDTTGGPAWRYDNPGRNPDQEHIDLSSIRVFILLHSGAAGTNEQINIAACVDSSGRWDPVVWNAEGANWVVGARWGEITNLGLLMTESGEMLAIDLRREHLDTDVLAVTYDIVNRDTDERIRVGDWSEDGSSRVNLDTQEPDPENGYLRLKLLKPAWMVQDPYTFQYVHRTLYSLGGANIDPESFSLEIEMKSALALTPEYYDIYGDEQNQIKWTRVFGLDMTDVQGAPGADGLVDMHTPYLIDLASGLLRFPPHVHRPFCSCLELYQSNLGDPGLADQLAENWEDDDDPLSMSLDAGIYDYRIPPAERQHHSHFSFTVSQLEWVGPSSAQEGHISLSRTAWHPASLPVDDRFTALEPEGRVETIRWFIPRERVLLRHLDPNLSGPARDITVPALQMYLRAVDDGTWDDGDWGGIMTGFSRPSRDLTHFTTLQIWINDFQTVVDERQGLLHIDLGYLSEDFHWPDRWGSLETRGFDYEDRNQDYVMQHDEDTGLDGVAGFDGDHVNGDDGRDDYSTEYFSIFDPYRRINGTEGNAVLDSEDVDGNTIFSQFNWYLRATLDLAGDEALVDVLADYTGIPVDERREHAWRLFEIPLDELVLIDPVRVGSRPEEATHIRIWYEDPDTGMSSVVTFQFAEFKFLGD